MSKTTLKLGKIEREVKTSGWSWGAFLLGSIWYFAHGMWGKGFVYALIGGAFFWTIIIPIVIPFAMGARFNRERYEHLLMKGYEEVDE